MKKALALILALVMCLSVGIMAFAGNYTDADATVIEEEGETTVTEEQGTADTKVDILVNTTNISVTVPLKFAIVADINGGSCDVPTDYAIINNSSVPVKVINAVKAVGADNDKWELVEDADTTFYPADTDLNQLDMTFTANGAEWNLYNTYAANWIIDAATGSTAADAGEMDITIAANSSKLNTTADQIDAFVITYTFAAITE